jgi:hypothetical protein
MNILPDVATAFYRGKQPAKAAGINAPPTIREHRPRQPRQASIKVPKRPDEQTETPPRPLPWPLFA